MTDWSGIERRKEHVSTGFCPAHIELVSDLAVIKECTKNIEKTLTESITFKNGVVFALIGVFLTMVINIAVFAFFFGQLNKQVIINTDRLRVIEESEKQSQIIRSGNVERLNSLEKRLEEIKTTKQQAGQGQ